MAKQLLEIRHYHDAGYRPPRRRKGWRSLRTFDPSRNDVMVWDDLNEEALRWRPEWAEQYRRAGDLNGANNFDGLLLTGWRLVD